MTTLTKTQLSTILSALDDRPRNPATKDAALKAIAKAGERFGLTAEDILGVAPGLLDGRLSPAEFRTELHDLTEAASKAPEVRLSDAQLIMLAEASRREDGSILPLPKSIKADAADRMVNSLIRRGLVERVVDERMAVDDLLRITRTGLLAIHVDPDEDTIAAPDAQEPEGAATAALEAAPADTGADSATAAPIRGGRPVKVRAGTKQALLIDLLNRDEGATIDQIVEATGWQPHTVRGAIAGALKKKLGLAVTSEKVDGTRVYRIQAQA